MMGPYYDPLKGQAHIYDTLNALAYEDRATIMKWLKTVNDKVKDDFLDLLARVIIACPWEISQAICDMYWRLSIGGINPEESELFKKRIIVDAIPTVVENLQKRASDLSLRSSFARKKESKTGSMDEGI